MLAELTQLLQIAESEIPGIVGRLDWRRSTSGKPSFGGVYAFWWKGSPESLLQQASNHTLHFKGPQQPIAWTIMLTDLKEILPGYVCLYVGKTHSDIAWRIGRHLRLGTERTVATTAVNGICKRLTTTCQVRDRLDRLFPGIPDTRQLALEQLALSYTRIDGEDAFVRRFFIEDLAIGLLQPTFNVDSER